MAMRTRRLFAYAVAAAAGIFGAGSLSLFGLFLWTVAFGLFKARLTPNSILGWDAALCLLFFLQHSGMVRRRFRAWLSGVVLAPCHGIVYTIASGAALFLLIGAWQPSTASVYEMEGAGRWLLRGVLLLCAGGILWPFARSRSSTHSGYRSFCPVFEGRQYPRPN